MPVDTRNTRDLVKEAVNSIFDDEWKNNLVISVANMVNKEICKKVDEINVKMQSLETRLKTLEEENSVLRTENNVLKSDNEKMEQYSRRNNIRIFGIEEKNGETVEDVIMDLFITKMGVEINKENIDRCHRVGATKPNKHRPIIVKFISYKHRQAVLKNKSKLKGTKCFIREDLTVYRQNLLSQAFANFDNAWAYNGKIFTVFKNQSYCIQSNDDLQKVLQIKNSKNSNSAK